MREYDIIIISKNPTDIISEITEKNLRKQTNAMLTASARSLHELVETTDLCRILL